MKPRGKAQWPPSDILEAFVYLSLTHEGSTEWVQLQKLAVLKWDSYQGVLGAPKVFQMPAEPKSLQRPILDTKYCQLSLYLVTVIIKFFMERWYTLRYLLLWVKSLKHTRSVPTTSSCSDNYIPCLMVDNYTITGIAKRKQWLRLFTARTHKFFLSLPKQALPWPAWCPW